MSNVEKLQAAGLIEAQRPLTTNEEELVNTMSNGQLEALISVNAKLGDAFFQPKAQPEAGQSLRMGTLLV